MKKTARVWIATAVTVALGAWTLIAVPGGAADDATGRPVDDIEALSDLIAKGDKPAAKKLAGAIAEKYEELDKIMHMFKPRNRKGLGVGAKGKGIKPDGIELKLLDLSKKEITKGQLTKEGSALARMGYNIAAIAAVAHAKPMDPKKDWEGWAADLKKGGLDLAKAAMAKDADAFNTTVSKLNASCASCHEKFRKNN